MDLDARYSDGLVPHVRDVTLRLDSTADPATLVVLNRATGNELDRWDADAVYPLHARKHELRIGAAGRPYGARVSVIGLEATRDLHAMLPALAKKRRAERGRQYRAMGLATGALLSVVVAYIYGVPLVARNIVALVPPEWEERFGATVAEQIETTLSEESGFAVCDPDPDSLANQAIARFAARAVDGTGTPFTPKIKVIRTAVPNAFALPGGRSFYFSALLEHTQTADEFAGVMAHELGHVVHRHGMEQLVSTSATGLLIGFILGDMTGLSVAGGLGAALIDNRFSREAEREADRFAADVARRMAFQPAGLANLLERVSGDDDMTRALALLSTHPLTSDRRTALEAMSVTDATLDPAFTDAEWRAIKTMCDPVSATSGPASPPAPAPPDKTRKNG